MTGDAEVADYEAVNSMLEDVTSKHDVFIAKRIVEPDSSEQGTSKI